MKRRDGSECVIGDIELVTLIKSDKCVHFRRTCVLFVSVLLFDVFFLIFQRLNF